MGRTWTSTSKWSRSSALFWTVSWGRASGSYNSIYNCLLTSGNQWVFVGKLPVVNANNCLSLFGQPICCCPSPFWKIPTLFLLRSSAPAPQVFTRHARHHADAVQGWVRDFHFWQENIHADSDESLLNWSCASWTEYRGQTSTSRPGCRCDPIGSTREAFGDLTGSPWAWHPKQMDLYEHQG